MNETQTAKTAQDTIEKSKVGGSKLDQQKCLVCPQPKAEGFYCSEHNKTVQAGYDIWKWDQERETRQKVSRAINRHLKDKSFDYVCQPTNCPELKAMIEQEVNRG